MSVEKLTDIKQQVIDKMTKQAYRTLTIAYKDIDAGEFDSIVQEDGDIDQLQTGLTLICIIAL